MATNQEKFDQSTSETAQIVSQQYKQDFWSGDGSRDARGKFIGQFLNHGVKVGDSKDQVTSLALFLQWFPAGLNNVYQAVLAGNAQTAALTEAIKSLAAAGLPGAAAFDEEAFFARIKGIVDASVDEGVGHLNSLTFTLTTDGAAQ